MLPLDSILPVVLVGGQSRRFGRDKLREPIGESSVLVEVPIHALREVFGPRVAVCGQCHDQVAALADQRVEDLYPRQGPLGGITSALRHAAAHGLAAVFILAGDLPLIDAAAVRSILELAEPASVAAVLARSDRPQPCIALYKTTLLPQLETARLATGPRVPALYEIVQLLGGVVFRDLDPRVTFNANTPEALARIDIV